MIKIKSTQAGPTMTLYVKNMVCDRCIRVVTQELERLRLDVRNVALGEVTLTGSARDLPMDQIKKTFEENGFELIEARHPQARARNCGPETEIFHISK
jgi:copper chaperone CopZ